jgi:hypothetical protein
VLPGDVGDTLATGETCIVEVNSGNVTAATRQAFTCPRSL